MIILDFVTCRFRLPETQDIRPCHFRSFCISLSNWTYI